LRLYIDTARATAYHWFLLRLAEFSGRRQASLPLTKEDTSMSLVKIIIVTLAIIISLLLLGRFLF
jgi:hypothetical protein